MSRKRLEISHSISMTAHPIAAYLVRIAVGNIFIELKGGLKNIKNEI